MPNTISAFPRQLRRAAGQDGVAEQRLRAFYEEEVRPRFASAGPPWGGAERYEPADIAHRLLQAVYIAQNPNLIVQKLLQVSSGMPSDYDRLHATFHPVARGIADAIGYHDVLLAGLDGYAVCKRLKADPRLKDIPVIFISALTETLDKVRAFQVGGVDYVAKPFDAEEVGARVQTHLTL